MADPINDGHRTRPEMRGDHGDVYPAADFIATRDGVWIDAVTGQTAQGFPENSSPDAADPSHRLLYKDGDNGEELIVAEYVQAPCASSRDLDEAILAEINGARADPPGYAAKLQGSSDPEVMEAVAFLRRQSPISPLKLQVALFAAASRHASDQGRAGLRGHVGSDGSTPRDRIAAAGVHSMMVGENIALDADTGAGVARQLIVDHGVPDHAHRASLFNAAWTDAGVACNPHATSRTICVIDVAGSIDR